MSQIVLVSSELFPSRPPPAPVRRDVADRDLVVRARNGEETARDELATRCGRASYAFALQLCGDPDLAADITQDSLMRFFKTLGRFDVDRPVVPWLFQIVRNRARDLQRQARTRAIVDTNVNPDDERFAAADRVLGPDARSERNELRSLLWRCVSDLSAPHREILVLRDYQDLSYREIAGVLRIPQGTVMSRLHAARKSLRKAVLGLGYDFGARA